MISRRSLLRGLSLAVAAPAIVRAASLMPVRAWLESTAWLEYPAYNGLYYPGTIARELSAITRKAFLSPIVVQTYMQSPSLATLLANR